MGSSETAWTVEADGFEVGRFDNFEDADNMASSWNSAYPHEPWFVVRGQPPVGLVGSNPDVAQMIVDESEASETGRDWDTPMVRALPPEQDERPGQPGKNESESAGLAGRSPESGASRSLSSPPASLPDEPQREQ